MEESGRLVESVALKNGLTVSFYDDSRILVGGRRQVRLCIVIPLELKEEYFKECPDPRKACEAFSRVCAGRLNFRQEKIRNFIEESRLEETLKVMMEEFLEYGRNYVGSPNFAKKFVMKRYYEWQKEQPLLEAHTEAIRREAQRG